MKLFGKNWQTEAAGDTNHAEQTPVSAYSCQKACRLASENLCLKKEVEQLKAKLQWTRKRLSGIKFRSKEAQNKVDHC